MSESAQAKLVQVRRRFKQGEGFNFHFQFQDDNAYVSIPLTFHSMTFCVAFLRETPARALSILNYEIGLLHLMYDKD